MTLGERKGQAARVVSKCLWDTNCDGYASECFENETLFCACQVRQVAMHMTSLGPDKNCPVVHRNFLAKKRIKILEISNAGVCAVLRVIGTAATGRMCETLLWHPMILCPCVPAFRSIPCLHCRTCNHPHTSHSKQAKIH